MRFWAAEEPIYIFEVYTIIFFFPKKFRISLKELTIFLKSYTFLFLFYKNYGEGKPEVTRNNMHGNIYWQALKRRQSYCHVVIFINTNTVNKRFARLSTTERTFSGPITENFNVMNLKEVISSPLCKLLQSHTWKYGLKDEYILRLSYGVYSRFSANYNNTFSILL